MANATLRANAQTLPEATSRRAILGAVLAAGALAAVPANSVAASLGMEPELQAIIAAWHEAERRLDETYDASCAADERAQCPVPQALIATERDANNWHVAVAGVEYREADVEQLRRWLPISRPAESLHRIVPGTVFDGRANEIIVAWDNWQAEQKSANEREGCAAAAYLWSQAVENYHAIGNRVAQLQARTMAGVIAKLLAAASTVTEDDLENDNNSHVAVLAGAALDARRIEKARS
jgi:hypothetical protein